MHARCLADITRTPGLEKQVSKRIFSKPTRNSVSAKVESKVLDALCPKGLPEKGKPVDPNIFVAFKKLLAPKERHLVFSNATLQLQLQGNPTFKQKFQAAC